MNVVACRRLFGIFYGSRDTRRVPTPWQRFYGSSRGMGRMVRCKKIDRYRVGKSDVHERFYRRLCSGRMQPYARRRFVNLSERESRIFFFRDSSLSSERVIFIVFYFGPHYSRGTFVAFQDHSIFSLLYIVLGIDNVF